jgi:hypothetical protein
MPLTPARRTTPALLCLLVSCGVLLLAAGPASAAGTNGRGTTAGSSRAGSKTRAKKLWLSFQRCGRKLAEPRFTG